MKKIYLFSGIMVILYLINACTSGKIQIKLENIPGAQKVDVTVGGNLFTSYCYSDTLKKPILFPIIAADGITITRGYPLFPRKGEQVDHPHQVGYWFAYGDVNGIDFWNNSSWIRDSDRYRYGTIRLKNIEKLENLKDKGVLAVNHEWVKSDGTVMIDEHTIFTFSAGKDYRIIDRLTTVTNKLSENFILNTSEGASGLRVARFLEFPSIKPGSFVDANGKTTRESVVNDEGVSGNYLSSEGIEGVSVWGTRAKWMKLYGVNGPDTISIVFMDHPSSFNYPTYWHARAYGLFAANAFGAKDFTNGKEELNFKFKEGEKITFKHRIYIKSGKGFPASEIEKKWMDFSKN